jgi:hypothetical protein
VNWRQDDGKGFSVEATPCGTCFGKGQGCFAQDARAVLLLPMGSAMTGTHHRSERKISVMKRSVSVPFWPLLPGLALLDLVLVGLILVQAPLLRSAPYLSTALFTILLLLFYGGVGVGLPQFVRSTSVKNVLWQATRIGLLIGLFFVVDIAVEYFVDLNQAASLLSTFGFMGLIFLAFAGAGVLGTRLTGHWLLGVLCSIWSAILAVLIALMFGMMVNVLFLQRLEVISAADYAKSGMHDPAASAFLSTLDNASTHLFEAPMYAAIFGTLGALIFMVFFTQRKASKRQKEETREGAQG